MNLQDLKNKQPEELLKEATKLEHRDAAELIPSNHPKKTQKAL